jgi:hypothetical protein
MTTLWTALAGETVAAMALAAVAARWARRWARTPVAAPANDNA